MVEELPPNDFESLAEDLENQHDLLFGETRSIGSKTWSKDWIHHDLREAFCSKIGYFYARMNMLKLPLRENIDDKTNQRILKVRLSLCLAHFVEAKNAKEQVSYPAKILLKTDSSPRGNISDDVEFWRQNIAIFRASL